MDRKLLPSICSPAARKTESYPSPVFYPSVRTVTVGMPFHADVMRHRPKFPLVVAGKSAPGATDQQERLKRRLQQHVLLEIIFEDDRQQERRGAGGAG
jgi:hypothetical protein